MCSVELKSISSICLFAIHTYTHIYVYMSVYMNTCIYIHIHIYYIVYSDQSRTVYFREKDTKFDKIKLGGREKENMHKTKISKLVHSSLIHIQYMTPHSLKCNNILFAHHFHT